MKTGFVCGSWDLLHPGHVIMLSECKRHCDALIVGLHTNPSIERLGKHKPIQTTYERYLQLAYNKSVYHVIPYDTEQDLVNLFTTMDLQIRFLGSDYYHTGATITGKDICEMRDIEIYYIDRLHSWSTTELRERLK